MKLSRQLLVIHSLIIFLLVLGYAWLSLLNIRQLTIQELHNQSHNAAQYLADPLHLALLESNPSLYQVKIDVFYDAGNYARISLFDGSEQRKLLYKRDDLAMTSGVPQWFVDRFPINAIVGQQELYKGITKVGVLEVEIHPFAFYQFVWRQFIDIASVTVFVGLVAWALGLALINIVLQPVLAVKRQAAAVAHKHYPQIQSHSGIAEFEQLIQVHNDMTKQIKVLFDQQQERMTSLKHELYHDQSSGLPNRAYFNLTLADVLGRQDKNASSGLIIVHLANASKLKHEQGYPVYKAVLRYVVKTSESLTGDNKNVQLFQLNEQDIVCLYRHHSVKEMVDYCKSMVRLLEDCVPLQNYQGATMGATEILSNDDQVSLMKRADGALKYAVVNDKRFFMDGSADSSGGRALFESKVELVAAIEKARIEFFVQPVVDPQTKNLLFTELYTKLSIDEEPVALATILALAEKYEVTHDLDRRVLTEVQKHYHLGAIKGVISVNISAFSLQSSTFEKWLFELFDQTPAFSRDLILEFDEIDLSQNIAAREVSYKLNNYGVEIAIDHFGRGSSSLSRFSDMKIHWLKIDSRYVHLDESHANRDYLNMICELVEKLGVKTILPNVETESQLNLAKEVGANGVQGFLLAQPISLYDQI